MRQLSVNLETVLDLVNHVQNGASSNHILSELSYMTGHVTDEEIEFYGAGLLSEHVNGKEIEECEVAIANITDWRSKYYD